jgi:hypothetical protein
MPARRTVSLPHATMLVYSPIALDIHQSAKIIRRTGDRRGADGVSKAC